MSVDEEWSTFMKMQAWKKDEKPFLEKPVDPLPPMPECDA
jgi:hypothetical protein